MTQRRTDTCYVVFQDSGTPAWWDGFVIPGFRHCWLMMPSYSPARGLAATISTLKIEPLGDYLDISHWQKRPDEAAAEIDALPETTVVIAFRATLPPERMTFPRGIRGLPTCVSMVKYALGLSAWSVWTPKHLCDYLLANHDASILTSKEPTDDLSPLEAQGT